MILAMRHPRRLVLTGCLSALIVMTILSAVVGWAAPNLLSRTWTHHITTVLFFGFGLWSLWDGFKGDGEAEELAEVEAKLDADWKSSAGTTKADDELKKKSRPFLAQFFSPILLKAFSITFFGEWGDKSQLATIGLAADENPFGVVLGGIVYVIKVHSFLVGSLALLSKTLLNPTDCFYLVSVLPRFPIQRSSIVYNCCRCRRKELGFTDI
ncbi:GDT1-like protein 4 [Linum perenne]